MPTMQAAVFKGNGVLELEQVEIPKIEHPDQVLLQVRAASICGSDSCSEAGIAFFLSSFSRKLILKS